MSSVEVINTGVLGPDFNRSYGRAYLNAEERVDSVSGLQDLYQKFQTDALEKGRRRTVVRVRCSREVFTEATALPPDDPHALPIEVALPLVCVDPQETDVILMLGKNVHPSLETVPEWSEVYQYWQRPNGRGLTPTQRITTLDPKRYRVVSRPLPEHAVDLRHLWAAFEWQEAGIATFINEVADRAHQWFSGIVDRHNGRLVSACMGEALTIANQLIVEGTEYGTLPGYEQQGLCTAAVVALHAQILQDTLYQTGQVPLIVSEFNMTSRSDVVGRHAGMTIPLVEGSSHLEHTPFQVLHRNVTVLDHLPASDINWRALGDQRQTYREAFRSPHRYWRNFIVGLLSRSAIETHYSPEQVALVTSLLNT